MYRYITKFANDNRSGEIIIVLQAPQGEEYKEEKGMLYVQFLKSKQKEWIYNNELEEL